LTSSRKEKLSTSTDNASSSSRKMERRSNNTPDIEVVRNTEMVVQYNYEKARGRRWARRINARLTKKEFELIEYEPGRAVYKKKTKLNVANE
jgi:hypothetical protein